MHNIKRVSFFIFAVGIAAFFGCKAQPKAEVNKGKHNFIIYQLVPRLFGNQNTNNAFFGSLAQNGTGKFNDINNNALNGLKELSVSYVWYTGIIAHASLTDYTKYGIAKDDADVVKGIAGSPYAIRDYYDVDPDLAVDVVNRMAEFEDLVKRTHNAGLKVLIDFVPNHVARGYQSLAKPKSVQDFGATDDKSVSYSAKNDFYYLPNQAFVAPKRLNNDQNAFTQLLDGKYDEQPAKATGNNVFKAQPDIGDWYETVKLNYGVDYTGGKEVASFAPIPPVWYKMKDILAYWAAKGVDGFRCDVVEMVPVAFWAWLIPQLKQAYPNLVFIGEAYDPTKYAQYISLGKFDYLYDKVGLYDGLKRFIKNEKTASVKDIQHVWQKESLGFEGHMVRFLENHDEERIASRFFAKDAKLAFPAMVVSATLGSGPLMLYFGQEVGEPGAGVEGFGGDDGRTSIFDYWGVPHHQRWLNGGKFDGGLLSKEEKAIRNFYVKLNSIKTKSSAIGNGKIEEVKLENHPKAYAYIRYTNDEKLLIIVNFDQKLALKTTIQLPTNLVSTAKNVRVTDLLTNKTATINNAQLNVDMLANSAQIIQL